ncbi:septal ring lytic transglycosylase RlpA family protein [Shewanella sp. NIFS-20-20]|uniref:septal ring lytic transglycosylase RlpA family protein n=1 Tax=Shewanella sp. NIFS-20-20 TaxID=2853806 RepID=UPI001C4805FF|nr:septal ring lytic transglycosylase RlpA family protein [Shewanella sp. NIFS-20-20]MBV7315872.1 septal ring lytic transglycosylase RlpA family protein [Shewanella sp. NIFS-20-20]
MPIKLVKPVRLFPYALLLLTLALGGCSSNQRYKMKDDKAPVTAPDVSQVEDAHARYEPYSRQANGTYTVLGGTYQVLPTAKGYQEQGTASWYGAKFHGHLTSNGEIYDMYSMSAAHKTLPIPSFAKVTNLANNKQVIVRVNDRGPFHGGRIIDLSYAAAYRLDMLKSGTANVSVEALHFESPQSAALAQLQHPPEPHYIQISAAKDKQKLITLGESLSSSKGLKYRLQTAGNLHRLQLGPIDNAMLADKLLQQLKQQGYPNSYLVKD